MVHCPASASHDCASFAPAQADDGCWNRVNSLGDLQAGLSAIPSDMSNGRRGVFAKSRPDQWEDRRPRYDG